MRDLVPPMQPGFCTALWPEQRHLSVAQHVPRAVGTEDCDRDDAGVLSYTAGSVVNASDCRSRCLGCARCRYVSAADGQAGGIWLSTQGVVWNASYVTCDKPRFPDSVRPYVNRYDVHFSPNGQCFREAVPPT